MPPVSEQPTPVPLPPTAPNTVIKVVRILLLVLIIIGLGLIATEKLWIPKLVNILVPSAIVPTTFTSKPSSENTLSKNFQWIPLSGNAKNSYYIVQNGTLYFVDVISDSQFPTTTDLGTFEYAVGADSSTSTIDYVSYAKDKNQVFYIGTGGCSVPGVVAVSGADPNTFRPLDSSLASGCSTTENWAVDGVHAYLNNQLVTGADPSTFKVLSDDYYAIDKNSVYCAGSGGEFPATLEGSDPATFVAWGDPIYGYAKDKNNVYANDCKVMASSDPATFTPLNPGSGSFFAKDKNTVWYWGSKVAGIDSNTLVFIGILSGPGPGSNDTYYGEYAKDKSHVYFGGGSGGVTTIQKADPATFILVNPQGESCGSNCQYDAKDKNHKYSLGQLVQ